MRCTISVAITLGLCLLMRSLPVVDSHYAAYLLQSSTVTVGTSAKDLTCVSGFGKKGERRNKGVQKHKGCAREERNFL